MFWRTRRSKIKTVDSRPSAAVFWRCVLCEPSHELQESLGPSGPEIPKKSEKCLPGPPALGPQKVRKKSRKSPKSLEKVSFETFARLFGTPGPEAPGDIFQTLLGFRARRARETLVARGKVWRCVLLKQRGLRQKDVEDADFRQTRAQQNSFPGFRHLVRCTCGCSIYL